MQLYQAEIMQKKFKTNKVKRLQNLQDKKHNDLNKVFIKGFNPLTSESTICSYFSKFGNLIHHTIIKDKFSNCYAFVKYSDSYMVDSLFQHRPHVLEEHNLDIHRVTKCSQVGQKLHERYTSIKKLFIGGINCQKISAKDLESYFKQFGRIRNIHIPRDKDYGFILFEDYDSVDKAILSHKNLRINDVSLSIEKALSSEKVTKSLNQNIELKKPDTIPRYDVSAMMHELLFKNSSVSNFPVSFGKN